MIVGGAAILMVAGDLLVRGAIGLSLKVGLSAALVSVTVVAFGTSAPELVISVEAALTGSPDIAVGNVVGSNIANVLLVLGVPALILPLAASGREERRGYVLMLVATALFVLVALTGEVGRLEGLGLLAALTASLTILYLRSAPPEEGLEGEGARGWMVAAFLVVGIAGLPLGASLLVDGARSLATSFGISEAAIGATVVALGTSLPELAASVAAAWRGRTEVALGNVLGSNMLNILAIIGITSLIAPLPVAESIRGLDMPAMILAALLLAPFLIRGARIGRRTGAAFVLLYAAFCWLALSGPALAG